MFNHTKSYIETYKNRWNDVTCRNIIYGLNALKAVLTQPEDPATALADLQSKYTQDTLLKHWVLLTDYAQHLMDTRHLSWTSNKFKDFKRRNRRAFKPSPVRSRTVDVSFEEAEQRITDTEMPENVRGYLLRILYTGMRVSEATKNKNATRIIGKGAKPRAVYAIKDVELSDNVPSQTEIRRHCKKIGVYGPHALRKLFATRLAEKGASPQDLCEVLGWADITTAYKYLQPQRESKLLAFVRG